MAKKARKKRKRIPAKKKSVVKRRSSLKAPPLEFLSPGEYQRTVGALRADPDWDLVSGRSGAVLEGSFYKQLAITRLTKRAVKALYPQYGVRANHGRRAARQWLHVRVLVPRAREKTAGLQARDERIVRRTRELLENCGIRYQTYRPDPTPEERACLTVVVREAS